MKTTKQLQKETIIQSIKNHKTKQPNPSQFKVGDLVLETIWSNKNSQGKLCSPRITLQRIVQILSIEKEFCLGSVGFLHTTTLFEKIGNQFISPKNTNSGITLWKLENKTQQNGYKQWNGGYVLHNDLEILESLQMK